MNITTITVLLIVITIIVTCCALCTPWACHMELPGQPSVSSHGFVPQGQVPVGGHWAAAACGGARDGGGSGGGSEGKE